jgi:hypothetical protein
MITASERWINHLEKARKSDCGASYGSWLADQVIYHRQLIECMALSVEPQRNAL